MSDIGNQQISRSADQQISRSDRIGMWMFAVAGASLGALVIQQAIVIVGAVTVTVCLIWLTRNISRGQVFSSQATRLVAVASTVGFVTYVAIPFFGNMAADGAFARLSDRGFDNVVMSIDLTELLLVGFVVALVTTVFAVGDRLRRDSEGLI